MSAPSEPRLARQERRLRWIAELQTEMANMSGGDAHACMDAHQLEAKWTPCACPCAAVSSSLASTCAALLHARMNRERSGRRRGPRPPVRAVVSVESFPPKVREEPTAFSPGVSAAVSFGGSSSGLLLPLTLELVCSRRLQR